MTDPMTRTIEIPFDASALIIGPAEDGLSLDIRVDKSFEDERLPTADTMQDLAVLACLKAADYLVNGPPKKEAPRIVLPN